MRIAVLRARLTGEDGKTRELAERRSLRAYQRRTRRRRLDLPGLSPAGTNTRRVRRALNAVFAGPVGKDVVSRVWRKTKGDWDAWNARSLAEEPIVRLILDGTVARVRLDRRATSISLLVALGVRADGQKMLLAIKSMGGEGEGRPGVRCSTISSGADCERRSWSSSTARRASKGGGGAVARHGCPTLHRAQASQSPRPRARAPARGNLERLPRHDLRRDARRGRDGARRSSANGASNAAPSPTASRCRRQAVHIHAVPAKPMEIDPNSTRSRACTRSSSAGSRPSDRAILCAETAAMLFGAARPQDRSPCARSTDGRPSPRNQTIRSLTSPHDRIASCRPEDAPVNSNINRDGTKAGFRLAAGPQGASRWRDYPRVDPGDLFFRQLRLKHDAGRSRAKWRMCLAANATSATMGRRPATAMATGRAR